MQNALFSRTTPRIITNLGRRRNRRRRWEGGRRMKVKWKGRQGQLSGEPYVNKHLFYS